MAGKRVISGLNAAGKSCVLAEGLPPKVHQFGGFSGVEVWTSRGPAPDLGDMKDRTPDITDMRLDFAPGETSFRIITIPPLSSGEDSSAMHATPTIDYIMILDGEIDLGFEDGSEAHLTPGDCVVQGGVMHSWRNRGTKPCRFAAIMIGASGTP